ncbi:MAG TPA: hypothetical protein QF480_01145 [Bacteroidales bacterium]|jgi:hypothetical protein|nr:hypothetical protein [Bacteroidota bacterium]HJN05196.1 hypothetical protein [Bacteroidales bacterium]|tara:strand:+ start:955 stop:1473 length:519 start_codon:yes stop_codon:yes gene_type:complete
MVKKEIDLLNNQIKKLDAPDFDFESWKKYSVIILARIFGSGDEKIKQLKNIDFEFTSWSLRDASGNESYEEGSKKLATEVLKAAIDELNIYGIPKTYNVNTEVATSELLNIILDEFKGSQVKELTRILSSKDSKSEKKRRVKELVEEIGEFGSYDIITNILTNPVIEGLVKN